MATEYEVRPNALKEVSGEARCASSCLAAYTAAVNNHAAIEANIFRANGQFIGLSGSSTGR